jgi:hypothetical protein
VEGGKGILGHGAGTETNGGACPVAQCEMSGQEIGMEVCQKNVTNTQSILCSVLEILVDVTLWIDDYGTAGGYIANQLRGMCQTAQIVLFRR